MPLSPEEQTIVDRFNAATTKIADRIRALLTSNVNDAEFNAQLTSIADGLEALGQSGPPPVV